MKKVILFVIVPLVCLSLMLISNLSFEEYNKKEVSDYTLNKYKNKAQNFNGYWSWLNKRRVDPNTGKLDHNAYIQARKQALSHTSSHTRELTLNWLDLGPGNHGGRTRAFLIDKDDHDVLYAGGVAGGLWTSTDAGYNWQKVTGFDDYQTVASICQTSNGDIYVGTGEGMYTNFGYAAGGLPGNGVYKSTDGATTFTHLSSTAVASPTSVSATWAHVNRLASDPNDANTVYAATEQGVKVTTDGGSSWSSINTSTIANGPFSDVDISSDGMNITVSGTSAFVSNDGGANFQDVKGQGGFPIGSMGRIEMAIAPSDPNYIYAACANGAGALEGIYQSTDGGQNWTKIGAGGSSAFEPYSNSAQSQGTYDNALGVALNNPEKIFLGGVKLYSWEASAGWNRIATLWDGDPTYYVHADMHYVQPHPTDANTIYFMNDGGVFVTYDGGESFAQMSHGYRTMQLYSVAVSDSGNVMGGHQDNGTHILDYTGATNSSTYEVNGGDGGYSAISWINSNAQFAATPNGVIKRSSNSGSSFSSFYDFNIDCEPNSNGNCAGDGEPDAGASFVTPFRLWESFQLRIDTTITAILPDEPNMNTDNVIIDTLIDSLETPNMFFAGLNNGVWMTKDALDFGVVPVWYRIIVSGGDIEALEVSKDGEHVFAGVGSSGKLYRAENVLSTNYGYRFDPDIILADVNDNGDSIYGVNASFPTDSVDINDQSLHTFGRIITSIAIDPNDANHVVVGLGNYFYTQNSISSYIYESTNALSATPTFTPINSSGLVDAPVYSVVIDMDDPSVIYAGTDFGVYATENGNGNGTSTSWSYVGPEKVPVFAMSQVDLSPKLSTITGPSLFIGTHGRGFFAHNFDPCADRGACVTSIDDKDVNLLDNDRLSIYPNPVIDDKAYLNIELNNSAEVNINIYDMQSKLVKSTNMNKMAKGVHNIDLDVSGLKGIYFVNVSVGGDRYSLKLIRL